MENQLDLLVYAYVGLVALFVVSGLLLFLVRALSVSFFWLILCIFVPVIGPILFLLFHWEEAKAAVFILFLSVFFAVGLGFLLQYVGVDFNRYRTPQVEKAIEFAKEKYALVQEKLLSKTTESEAASSSQE